MRFCAILAILAAAAPGQASPQHISQINPEFDYSDATRCVEKLANSSELLPDQEKRRCMIAVATTYVEAEQNTLPPERMLLTDDISRHQLGTAPEFAAGNRARIVEDNSHSVIGSIQNRRWTVDGDEAWIVYDGYFKTNPTLPGFHVAERFTFANGLIREIMIAGVKAPDAAPGDCIE